MGSIRSAKVQRAATTPDALSPDPVKDFERFLHFCRGNRWERLPGWARFFISAGAGLATGTDDQCRTVFAIAVPARGYGATLSASGAVLARAKVPIDRDIHAHFAFLSSLPAGALVRYISPKGTKYVGKLERLAIPDRNGYVAFRSGEIVHRIPVESCCGIQPITDESVRVPKRWSPQPASPDAGLVDALLEPDVRASFRFRSRIECVVVGNERALLDEATAAPFAIVRPGKQPLDGRLQDVLRVRRSCRYGEGYRSEVYPASGGRSLDGLPSPPPLAIFDGSLAFLNRGSLFPSSNWLVILDRTEPRFLDAVSEINRLFLVERVESTAHVLLPEAPRGLDATVFELVAQ